MHAALHSAIVRKLFSLPRIPRYENSTQFFVEISKKKRFKFELPSPLLTDNKQRSFTKKNLLFIIKFINKKKIIPEDNSQQAVVSIPSPI